MITESGSIKVTTQLNEEVQKEFSHANFLMALILTIIGSIGVAVFLTFEIVSIFLEIDGEYFPFLMIFAVALGLGIAIFIMVNKAIKTAGNSNKSFTFEFFKDYFITTESLNGETVGTAKIYNSQVIKARETKDYLFFYTNAVSACPVDKRELTEAEINTLRSIFKLPVKGDTVALMPEVLQSAEPQQPSDDDVFDEFKK